MSDKCLGHLKSCLVQARDLSKHFETIYVTKPIYTNGMDDTTAPERPTMRCSKTNIHKTEEQPSTSV